MSTVSRIQTAKELKPHLNELADVLSRAFYDDPYYVHIMPDNARRKKQLKWFMNILLNYTLENGTIIITQNKGILMWFGPDNPFLNNFKFAVKGMILYPFKVGIKGFRNFLNISAEWEKEHAKQNKRHYYFLALGIDPASQKKGLGRDFISEIFVKADEEKLDCYLETVTQDNVSLYRKLGFEVINSKAFGENYMYYIMKRTPKYC